jgi:hypothetical protein
MSHVGSEDTLSNVTNFLKKFMPEKWMAEKYLRNYKKVKKKLDK